MDVVHRDRAAATEIDDQDRKPDRSLARRDGQNEHGEDLAGQVVEKGSVTLDGTSLTVASVGESSSWGGTFDVALIPHTLEVTTLGVRSPGDRLKVEADVIARYVAGLLGAGRISIPTAESSEKKGGD